MPRDELGVAYAVADAFLFPSTTDTQGLVIHEAALAGLPLVLCDKDVSEVFIENETGLLAPAGARRFAQTALQLLGDDKLRERLGDNARKLAGKFTEAGQTKKLEQLYLECVENHVSKRRR